MLKKAIVIMCTLTLLFSQCFTANVFAKDTTAPVFKSSTPKNNATSIATNVKIKLKFSENIYKGSNFSKIKLTKSGKTVSIKTSISSTYLIISHTYLLANNKTYVLSVPVKAIKDKSGNYSKKAVTIKFKTKPVVAVKYMYNSKIPYYPSNIYDHFEYYSDGETIMYFFSEMDFNEYDSYLSDIGYEYYNTDYLDDGVTPVIYYYSEKNDCIMLISFIGEYFVIVSEAIMPNPGYIDEIEPNDTLEDSDYLQQEMTAYGTLGDIFDLDVYRVIVDHAGYYNIYSNFNVDSGNFSDNYEIFLCDNEDNVIADTTLVSDPSEGNYRYLNDYYLEPGEYFIEVTPNDSFNDSMTSMHYELIFYETYSEF